MKVLLKVIGLLIIVGALAGAVVLVKKNQEMRKGAAYAEVEALFLPESKTLKVGESFSTVLVLDVKTAKLVGIDVRVKFDQSKLKVEELKPIIASRGTGGMFKSESEVLKETVDGSNGLITLAGVSMESDVAKFATGVVNLWRITFKAIGGGGASVTLDKAYSNMAAGYNPGSEDQKLNMGVIKGAVYTIEGGETEKCGWCGNQCVLNTVKKACPDVMPPEGKTCSEIGGKCQISPPDTTPVPTTGTDPGKKCGDRCTRIDECGEGYECVPIWWPTDCQPLPLPILSKVGSKSQLTPDEVKKLIADCPSSKNALLDINARTLLEIGELKNLVVLPALIGICRSEKCPQSTSAICDCSCPVVPKGCTAKPVNCITGGRAGLAPCCPQIICPSGTPTATGTIKPTSTPVATVTVKPTNTPTGTIKPTNTPVPTATIKPTGTVVPTATVRPTNTLVPTQPASAGDSVLNYKVAFGNVPVGAECAVNWPLQLVVLGNGVSKVYTNVVPTRDTSVTNKLVFGGTLVLAGFREKTNVAVFIKGPKHLQVKYGVNNQSAAYGRAGGELVLTDSAATSPWYDFSGYPLLAGDVTGETGSQDGWINGLDFSLVKQQSLTHETVANGGTLQTDLDGNCQVNSNDVTVLKISLNEKQESLY